MRNTLNLLQMIPNRVRDYIATVDPGRGTLVAAGWKALAHKAEGKGSANRIVFVPIDGTPMPTTNPGIGTERTQVGVFPTHIEGRELFGLGIGFEVHIWGYDGDNPTSSGAGASDIDQDTGTDMRHLARCLELLSLTSQALQKLGWGAISWGTMRFRAATIERRHGVMLIANLVVRVPILDADVLFHKPVRGVLSDDPIPESESP